jgi:L-aminopeptidase/D-esterase-like protein
MIRRVMTRRLHRSVAFPAGAALLALAAAAAAATPAMKPAAPPPPVRARDLGIPFDGTPGPLNAITDVAGVTVGSATIDAGDVHTGVTAVLPRGSGGGNDPVFAGWFAQNGNGEMTGTSWVEESGFLEGPVMITNTHSVGVVRDAVIRWRLAHGGPDADGYSWSLPVVGETWDGWLNDVNGFHVTAQHAFAALDSAHAGHVEEGSVGGGTGMICNGYKGGIGTASRRLDARDGGYTVGVLVQCNYGTRQNLRIAGIPVGREIPAPEPYAFMPSDIAERGSIIVVVATDAPLLAHQLKRVAHRVTLALGRTGSISGDGSGDIFIAFSTANPGAATATQAAQVAMLPNGSLDPVFGATVEATEEAIVNAMIAARDMTGIQGHRVIALPHAALQDVLRKYNRLVQ